MKRATQLTVIALALALIAVPKADASLFFNFFDAATLGQLEVTNTKAGDFDGIGYVWEYKVNVVEGIDRGLSHWTLELCAGWFDGQTNPLDLTYFDADPDPIWNAPTNPAPYTGSLGDVYDVETGTDPTLGITGIKYNAHQSVGELKDVGDMEFFSFRLNDQFKAVEQSVWGVKAGQNDYLGSVLAPGCDPCDPIPEPTTLLLLGGGLLGGVLTRRRVKK